MARLRNRIRKADFFSDGELLRWPRDKRTTYSGLYALAEDSGCLEDDVYTWKALLWPSVLDADITVGLLEEWRDEMVEAKKLIPYEVNGQGYLFLKSFHTHEHPRNPQAPTIPLAPWVRWVPYEKYPHKGQYEVDGEVLSAVLNGKPSKAPAVPKPKPKPKTEVAPRLNALEGEFEKWWTAYGKVGSRARAYDLYRHWRLEVTVSFKELFEAATAYRDHCVADDQKMMHASTFLAKPTKDKSEVWREWAEGEEHGSMDVRSRARVNDVLEAGARAFGLIGGEDDRALAAPPERGLGSGEDAEYAEEDDGSVSYA